MSVIGIATDILMVANAIRVVCVRVSMNKLKADRLATRVSLAIPTLQQICADPSKFVSSIALLEELLNYTKEIKAFLEKFQNEGYLKKVFNLSSEELKFVDYNEGFQQRCAALQFNLATNAEKMRQEDDLDAKQDAEQMKGMMRQLLESQGAMREEIDAKLNQLMSSQHQVVENITSTITEGNISIMNALHDIRNGLMHKLPPLRNIAVDDLVYSNDEENLIGSGSFGKIYKGEYQGFSVAVKTIKSSKMSRSAKDELHREAITLQMVDHPGVVHFYGANLETSPKVIVLELCHCSLDDVMYKTAFRGVCDLFGAMKVSLLQDLSSTILFLHGLGITHGDLKPKNVLVTNERKVKITDFGAAKINDNDDGYAAENAKNAGSPAYLAPEIFRDHLYSKSSDVYAFGMMMNELFSHAIPFAGLSSMEVMVKVLNSSGAESRPPLFKIINDANSSIRTEVSDDILHELQSLVCKCWEEDRDDRPSFSIVSKILTRIEQSLGGDPRKQKSAGSITSDIKETTTSSKTGSSSAMPAAKIARDETKSVMKEWLIQTVELFPDKAADIAEMLVNCGVTNVRKIRTRMESTPNFLESIGVSKFEAADIQYCLNNSDAGTDTQQGSKLKAAGDVADSKINSNKGNDSSRAVDIFANPSAEDSRSLARMKSSPNSEQDLFNKISTSRDVNDLAAVINEIYLRNDHQFGDNFLLALLEAVTKLSKVSATHAANFGQHDSCAQLVAIVQRFCGNNLNIQTMAAIAFTSLLPLNQKANNKQLGIPCCQFIVNSLLPFTTQQGVTQFKQVVATGQTAIVFGLTWKMMEAMLILLQNMCQGRDNKLHLILHLNCCSIAGALLDTHGRCSAAVGEQSLHAMASLAENCVEAGRIFFGMRAGDLVCSILRSYDASALPPAFVDAGLDAIRGLSYKNRDNSLVLGEKNDSVALILQLLLCHGVSLNPQNGMLVANRLTAAESGMAALASLLEYREIQLRALTQQQTLPGIINILQVFKKEPVLVRHSLCVLNYLVSADPSMEGIVAQFQLPQLTMELLSLHCATDALLCTEGLKSLIINSFNRDAIWMFYVKLGVCNIVGRIIRAHTTLSTFELTIIVIGNVLPRDPQNALSWLNTENILDKCMELLSMHLNNCTPQVAMETLKFFISLNQREVSVGCVAAANLARKLLVKYCANIDANSMGVVILGIEVVKLLSRLPSFHQQLCSGEHDVCGIIIDVAARNRNNNDALIAPSIEALANLSMNITNASRLIKMGLCELALAVAGNTRIAPIVYHALRIISLSGVVPGAQEILVQGGACFVVAQAIRNVLHTNGTGGPYLSDEAIAVQAAVALYNLCCNNHMVKQQIQQLQLESDLGVFLYDDRICVNGKNQVKTTLTAIRS